MALSQSLTERLSATMINLSVALVVDQYEEFPCSYSIGMLDEYTAYLVNAAAREMTVNKWSNPVIKGHFTSSQIWEILSNSGYRVSDIRGLFRDANNSNEGCGYLGPICIFMDVDTFTWVMQIERNSWK